LMITKREKCADPEAEAKRGVELEVVGQLV
jgi:hypothetical protein